MLPMDNPEKIMIFFASLQGAKWSKVRAYKSSAAHWHAERRLPPPQWDHPGLQRFWRGLRKSCDNKVSGKRPLTKAELYALLRYWGGRNSLAGCRNMFIAVVQFYTAKRWSELAHLQRSDITPHPQGFLLQVHRSKSDPFGRGSQAPLPEKTKDGVPIGSIIRNFLRLAPTEPPLLRATHPANKGGGWKTNALTREAWHAAIRDSLKAALPQLDLREVGTHSLRKGGFTAAKQAGLPHDVAIDLLGHNSLDAWLHYCKRPRAEIMAYVARI